LCMTSNQAGPLIAMCIKSWPSLSVLVLPAVISLHS